MGIGLPSLPPSSSGTQWDYDDDDDNLTCKCIKFYGMNEYLLLGVN